jgi:hypothetical protein
VDVTTIHPFHHHLRQFDVKPFPPKPAKAGAAEETIGRISGLQST